MIESFFFMCAYFGAGLCFLMAMEQLVTRGSGVVNKVSAMLFFCNGINTIVPALMAKGVHLDYPAAVFLFLPSIFAIGPLNHFYYDSLLNPQGLSLRRLRNHLVPAMLVLAADIALQLAGREFHLVLIRKTFSLEYFTPITFVVIGAAAHAQFYLSRLVVIEAALIRDDKIREEMTLIALCNGLAVVCGVFNLIGFFGKRPWGYLTASVICAVIHAGIFIEHSRSPQFFQIVKQRIRERRYRNSTLRGIDAATVLERLRYLLETERVYTDYEITLEKLANKLGITPHQLSELINDRLSVNFQNLINRHRVMEAQRLLGEDPDRSVLSICFHVGFSSKSAFNRAFRKQTGMGPAEFKSLHTAR